ncbi:MAG: D-glycero-beta-D-manno-heptose-7-phosphate kinase [Planctomycetes bacterium]|nr:D-glycero-beta-D-manno-heptose-7-phosphate kinase [Planctomycetota bacterium]
MTDNILQTLEKLNYRVTIAVVGDVMLDRFVWGKVRRISPEAPVPVLEVSREETRLGGAANVANNLASLGASTICYGCVGNDHNGQVALKLLKDAGIGIAGIVKASDRNTIIKTRMIAHAQQVIRVDSENTQPLAGNIESAVFDRLRRNAAKYDVILVSDYNKGMLTENLLHKIIRMAKSLDKPVIIDPKGRDYAKYFGADGITPNLSETELAAGMDIADDRTLKSAALKLLRKLNLKFLVVTRGEKGMSLFNKDGSSTYVPAKARAVYDVTGAGDTVLATLGFALANNIGISDSVKLANYAAGVVVGKLGTATTNLDELRDYISESAIAVENTRAGAARKIMTASEIGELLAGHRKAGEKIVFTNGCFDILHSGHIKTLEFAKSCGDVLVAGLNSDSSVRKIKGNARPVLKLAERQEVLAAIEYVDYVVVFDAPTPEKLIHIVRPDVLVKGADWKGKKVVGGDFVKSYGGKVSFVPLIKGVSTTDIITRIRI